MKTISNIDFTFNGVYKLVKDSKNDELKSAFDSLFSVGLLLVPTLICKETSLLIALSSGMHLIGTKDVLKDASKKLINCVIGDRDKNYRKKYERMQMAHVLICFTAFYETIDELLPDLKKEMGLMNSEKLFISEEAIQSFKNSVDERMNDGISDEILDFSLPFPHPADKYNNHTQLLSSFYEKLKDGFISFLHCLAVWENKEEHKKEETFAILKEIVPQSIKAYKHQYFELAVSFNEFFVWVNNKEHKDIEQKVDIGFFEINDKIDKILEEHENSIGIKVFKELSSKYDSIVNLPIIESTEMNRSTEELVFPSKSKIFIPQQFKAVYYRKKEKLEDDSFWKNIAEGNNLGEFINGLMSHSSSNDFPVIILGHPGSGKSLLCNMLSSKILGNRYNVILVKLRSINAENTIIAQIESQITDEIGRKCNWTDIADCHSEKDAIVIFDGYDELLQASGKTYANYVKQIQEFQQNEVFVGRRPVKCILTSRITLIDKAFIPDGTTIIKLLDFDSTRIELWTNIWNETNKEYFTKNNVRPLVVPDDKKIIQLAKQPLLLLMLALFDSNGNQIEKHQGLDLTELYYNLITEFIKRERNKDSDFKNTTLTEQEKSIHSEVNKVGIAAIGMFNRKTLYIHAEQLNGDIAFFENSSENKNNTLKSLTNADLLLGSFFFVYKSDSKEYENFGTIDKSAYEFLHNTFGEFLTANFILNSVYEVINTINVMNHANVEFDISRHLNHKWYGTLIYSPIFSRPVVVKMLSEWFPYFVQSKGMDNDTFLQNYDMVINHEIQQITDGNHFNSVMTTEEKSNPYDSLSLISHLAIYSVNLIMIRCAISRDKFVLNNLYNHNINNGVNKWTKLVQLWKSEFSYENLYTLSYFIFVNKLGDMVEVKYIGKNTEVKSQTNQLQLFYNVGVAIGDDFMAGTSGLLLKNYKNFKTIINCLERENIEVEVRLILDKLVYEIAHYEINYKLVFSTFDEALGLIYKKGTKEDLFLLLLLTI